VYAGRTTGMLLTILETQYYVDAVDNHHQKDVVKDIFDEKKIRGEVAARL